VYAEPVRELGELRQESVELRDIDVVGVLDLGDRVDFPVAVSELLLEFERPSDDATVGVELSNAKGERYRVGYDGSRDEFFSDRTKAGDAAFASGFANRAHRAPRLVEDDTVRLHVWFDVASAELFADGGATVMTDIFFPAEPYTRISLYATRGKARIERARITRLSSIW
jgi:fructan beta-fructosidase